MKTAIHLGPIVCTMCLLTTSISAEDGSTDKARFQGFWSLVSGETNGRPLKEVLEEKELGSLEVVFSGDHMTMRTEGRPDHKFRFSLDPKTRPRTLQMVPLETHARVHEDGRAVLYGIYQIQDGNLKLCLPNRPGVDQQPTKFEAPSGSLASLVVLHRQTEDTRSDAELSDERERE